MTFNVLILAISLGSVFANVNRWDQFDDQNLQSLLENAEQNNRDLKQLKEKLIQYGAAKDQYTAQMYPMISLTAARTWLPFSQSPSAPPILNAPDVMSVGSVYLNAYYGLDIWWKGLSSVSEFNNEEKALESEIEDFKTKLYSSIASQYFSVVLYKAQLEILNKQLQRTSDDLEITKSLYNAGTIGILSLLQQEQKVAQIESEIPLMESNLLESMESLKNITGKDDVVVQNDFKVNKSGVEVNVFKNNELEAAEFKLKAAKASNYGSWLNHLPNVELTGRKGYDYTYVNDSDWKENWSVGLNMSLVLFKGFGDLAAHRSTQSKVREAHYKLNEVKSLSEINNRVQRQKSKAQLKNYLANKKYFEASKRTFDEGRSQYKNGLVSYLNYSQIRNQFYLSEQKLLNAEFQFMINKVNSIKSLSEN